MLTSFTPRPRGGLLVRRSKLIHNVLSLEGPGLLCEGDWIVKLTNSKVMIRTTMELSEANFVVRVVQPVPRRTLGARARRSPINPQPRK